MLKKKSTKNLLSYSFIVSHCLFFTVFPPLKPTSFSHPFHSSKANVIFSVVTEMLKSSLFLTVFLDVFSLQFFLHYTKSQHYPLIPPPESILVLQSRPPLKPMLYFSSSPKRQSKKSALLIVFLYLFFSIPSPKVNITSSSLHRSRF